LQLDPIISNKVDGRTRLLNGACAILAERTQFDRAARPREFGEQTEEVLAEFGFGADEVAQLRQAKVV
jgi:crotonobetainyl-CoA:carnitine CoA-transferase CaiB-like acyl-CoA transferase